MNEMTDPQTDSPSPAGEGRADARAYIDAVRAALAASGVQVSSWNVRQDELRRAELTVERDPEEDLLPWPNAERFLLGWNEEEGWYLIPVYPAVPEDDGLPPSDLPEDEGPWLMGEGVIPAPSAVAAWVDLLTTMPSAVPSYPHDPYRSRADSDPWFETALDSYNPPPAG